MFKVATLAVVSIFLSGPVAPVQTGPGTRYFDGPPPIRFVREGLVPVLFVAPARLAEACAVKIPPGIVLMACARTTKDGLRVVIMPHPAAFMGSDPYAQIMAHELGHVAGWSGNHEQ